MGVGKTRADFFPELSERVGRLRQERVSGLSVRRRRDERKQQNTCEAREHIDSVAEAWTAGKVLVSAMPAS